MLPLRSLAEDGRWHSHPLARMDARRLSAAFQLRENVPTCSAGVSGSLRRGAKARIGRGGFASPPVGAAGSIRATPHWRSLTRLHPRLAADIHPELNGQLDPSELAAGSRRKVWWLGGRCGHAWQATIDNRAVGGVRAVHACPRGYSSQELTSARHIRPVRAAGATSCDRPGLCCASRCGRQGGRCYEGAAVCVGLIGGTGSWSP